MFIRKKVNHKVRIDTEIWNHFALTSTGLGRWNQQQTRRRLQQVGVNFVENLLTNSVSQVTEPYRSKREVTPSLSK